MKEFAEPKHDRIVLRAIDYEDTTASGLILAKPGDYDHLKSDQARRGQQPGRDIEQQRRATNRYEVLAVGPGRYVDVADDVFDQVFIRKPMCCEAGDIIIAQEGPKPFPCNGELLYMAQDHEILARINRTAGGQEQIEPLNDYIFSKESAYIAQSTGGVYMPGISDPTGNKKLPIRFVALGVSDGPWALRMEPNRKPTFARRPMSVEVGQEFAYDGVGFLTHIGGAAMVVTQDYMTACVFRGTEATVS